MKVWKKFYLNEATVCLKRTKAQGGRWGLVASGGCVMVDVFSRSEKGVFGGGKQEC